MAFIKKEDLGSAMYGYIIEDITEGNDDLVLQAINTAISEVKGYLLGASRYNVPLIFSMTGGERESILVTHCATISKFYLCELCNADIIQEQAKDRYDRATAWLKKLGKGEVTLDLPLLPIGNTEDELDGFGYGSRKKFTHDIE